MLRRTFESLCHQSDKDFEWLIIDDGSTDNTEAAVKAFISEADFPVHYHKKENGGKYTAYNVALDLAQGELFFTLDSDDWLPEDSISIIKSLSVRLMADDTLAGILALKEFPDGKIIGRLYPQELDFDSLVNLEVSGNGGERSLVFKTEVARAYPFPLIQGEKFVGESVVYDRIGARYNFLVSNDVLTICEYQNDGLSSNIYRLFVCNPSGYVLYYSQRIDLPYPKIKRFEYAIKYNAFRFLSRKNERFKYKYTGKHRLLIALTLPIGLLAAGYYKKKSGK